MHMNWTSRLSSPTTIFIFIFLRQHEQVWEKFLMALNSLHVWHFPQIDFPFIQILCNDQNAIERKFSPYCTSATIKKKKVVIAQFFHVQSNAHFMIFYVQQVKLLLSIAAFYFFSSKEMTLNFLLWWSSSFWVTEKIKFLAISYVSDDFISRDEISEETKKQIKNKNYKEALIRYRKKMGQEFLCSFWKFMELKYKSLN